MKRLAVAACGALIGLGIAAGLGACDCPTTDLPLMSGTYKLYGRGDYTLVLDLERGSVVETYTDGDEVRVEYAVGPDMLVP